MELVATSSNLATRMGTPAANAREKAKKMLLKMGWSQELDAGKNNNKA